MKIRLMMIIAAVVMMGALLPVVAQSPSVRKVIEVLFSGGSGTYTWPVVAANPPELLSIDVTFRATNASPSTFTLAYTRSNVVHTMLVMTNIYRTGVWYLPNSYVVKGGDRWDWTTTSTNAAVLTVNARY